MFSRIPTRPRLPLAILLTLPLVALLVITTLAIATIAHQGAQRMAAETATKLFDGVNKRVEEQLNCFLAMPPLLNRLNAERYLDEGLSDPTKLPEVEKMMFHNFRQFPSVDTLLYVTPQGIFRNFHRYRETSQLEFTEGDYAKSDNTYSYNINDQGQKLGLKKTFAVDVRRDRPWYPLATTTKQPGWSPVFPLGSLDVLTINAYQPVFQQGELQAVFATNVSLQTLTDFVEPLLSKRSGEVFITEPDGKLIASSGDAQPFQIIPGSNSKFHRLHSRDSQNPLIRETSKLIIQTKGGLAAIEAPVTLPLTFRGNLYYVHVRPFTYPGGIDWRIGMIVPEASFLKQFQVTFWNIWGLAGVIVLLVIGLGVWLATCFNRLLNRFNHAALAMAEGNLDQYLPTNSLIEELFVLARAFNWMAEQVRSSFADMQTALAISEDKLKHIINSAGVVVTSLRLYEDFGYGCDYVSGGSTAIFGYTPEEFIAQPLIWQERIIPEDMENLVLPQWRKVLDRSEELVSFSYRFRHKDERIRWIDTYTKLASRQVEGCLTVISVSVDVTDRRNAEEQIKAALSDREVLLTEVHHRVKNNLQIISSLLDIQANRVEDAYTRAALWNSRNRVYAMALVHELLYSSRNFGEVNLADYIQSLTSYLLIGTSSEIELISQVDRSIHVSLDEAIPLGLIINELVTNCLKYGCPQNQGQIYIALSREDHQNLCIGVGNAGDTLPPNFDIHKTVNSTGLKLVLKLVKQIQGKIRIERNDTRTMFYLDFNH